MAEVGLVQTKSIVVLMLVASFKFRFDTGADTQQLNVLWYFGWYF